MEVFSASISVEPSQEAEFRAQFEQTTERWGESPQFLWSSLLSSADANNKFIICTGWNTSDNQSFNQGLETLKQFQQMFGRVEEFQSIETFEKIPEIEATPTSVESFPLPSSNSASEGLEDDASQEAPINLQTGRPSNWIEDEDVTYRENFYTPSFVQEKANSSTLLAEYVGDTVSIWSQNLHSQYRDQGLLTGCDEHWVRILDSGDQTLIFPTIGVRLVKIHK